MVVNEVTVSSACKHLSVSTSGYYAWRKRQANTAQKYNDLKAVYWQHDARSGAPSLVHDRVRRHSANGWLSPEAFEQKYFKKLEGSIVHDTV